MKDILIWILKPVICFLILILSLVIVNLIPREYIQENVKESVQIFIDEGYFPKVKLSNKYLLDNWTDALMINTAYSIDTEEPIRSSILMRRNYRPNAELKLDQIVNDKPIEYLIENLNETNNTYFEYSRYWHGYMIYLRPLLVLFNYSQIRIFFTTIIITLSFLLIYLVYKKIDKYIAIATTIMLFISNFWAIGLSLQYSAVFIITLISSMYIISKNSIKNILRTFFIIGMLTSFFDLLTTPILTLGIPLIFYISLNRKEDLNFKEFFKIILFWGMGYGLMWLSKWVISDIICNVGTIQSAIIAIKLRVGEAGTSIINVILANIYYLFEIIILIISMAITTFIYVKNKKQILKIKKVQQYLIIAIIPFIWYTLLKNHSFIHARFTFRNLLLTVFSLTIITIKNIFYMKENK